MAKAVRDEIHRILAAWSSSHTRTSRCSLWLLEAPTTTPALKDSVWAAVQPKHVDLAALEAMEHSRQSSWRLHRNTSPHPAARTTSHTSPIVPFWSNLLDMANTFSTLPPAWQDIVDQPFLATQQGRLAVVSPPLHPFQPHDKLVLTCVPSVPRTSSSAS